MEHKKQPLWLPLALMGMFALTRWPGLMPENFSAAYALAFCGGVYFSGAMAWWLPLGALVLTSTLLNLLHYDVPVLNIFVLISYAAFAAIIGLGRLFRGTRSILKLLGGGLIGAVLFYLITNTASWIFEPTQPYPRTLSGWIRALTIGTAGWPETWMFFRNTLLSSGLFTGLFVGSMKLAESMEPQEEAEPEDAGASEEDEGAARPVKS